MYYLLFLLFYIICYFVAFTAVAALTHCLGLRDLSIIITPKFLYSSAEQSLLDHNNNLLP